MPIFGWWFFGSSRCFQKSQGKVGRQMRNANSQFETALLGEDNTEGTNIRNPKKSHLSNNPVPRERGTAGHSAFLRPPVGVPSCPQK